MDSDANDRIRWGDKIKVYTRRNPKKNGVSPATTTATATVEAAAPAAKGNDNNDDLIANFTSGNVPDVITRIDDGRIRISLTVARSRSRSGIEILDLRRTFEGELEHVRNVVKKLEAKEELQLTSRGSSSSIVGVPGVGGGGGGGIISRNYQRYTGGVDNVIDNVGVPGVGGGILSRNYQRYTGVGDNVIDNNDGGGSIVGVPGVGGGIISRNYQRYTGGVDNVIDNNDGGGSIVGVPGVGGGILSRNYQRYPGGVDNVIDNRSLVRVNSAVGSMGHGHGHIQLRQFRPPGLAVVVKNDGSGEFVEREKRTPKANQYYKNSEFLLGKDRLPSESNKKLKTNGGGKKHRGGSKHGFGFDDKYRKQLFRSCSDLLGRLMKHKHGWVFNEPVNVKALGLHDYLDIIKHPMDLGTIKARLSQNWYKSPKEFAEDIRLVFSNAKTYNPKGQDVHVMAEELSQIFEERWAAIEVKYNPEWRYQMYHDAGLPIPTSRKPGRPPNFVREHVPYHALTHAPQARTLERSESITGAVDSRKKASSFSHVGRTPAPKKPKAKDPNKRDMRYEEKQKLSTELENLPQEKLDAIIQIIKKRSSALSQNNEEIEVDIDRVDAETLWELDRFVTNYKKSLSKNKRKAELALQARAAQSAPVTNSGPMVADALKESRTEGGKQADNASSSSSSSSSSSDSGSSSSDSDSDSSSSCGSDAGH